MSKRFRVAQRVDFIKEVCAGKKVLHLGCSNHPYTLDAIEKDMLLHFELAKSARELFGFDYDQEGLNILAEAGVTNLYRADLEDLDAVPLNDTFDVVIGGEMIEHLSNPGKFLEGIKRFMNVDTDLVITTVNAYCAMRFLIYGVTGKGGSQEPVHPDHVAYYSYRTLNLTLERANLRLKDFLFYDIGKEHRPFNRKIYNAFNDVCVRFFPQFSDGIIAVAGLK
ncbi:MAG TPA: methyltransferase domain-containing protein [Pyrinomonadaceae bacterium]|nr:methyltransferase domain-containing protein [Pyrinomonadaceae bacterium]